MDNNPSSSPGTPNPKKKTRFDGSDSESSVGTTDPPLKKTRHWRNEMEAIKNEDAWFNYMREMRDKQVTWAMYNNAKNTRIEITNRLRRGIIENEAVTMAIRSHGLCMTPDNIRIQFDFTKWPQPEDGLAEESDDNEGIVSISSDNYQSCASAQSTDDLLTHAVAAAIKKKGLGAADR